MDIAIAAHTATPEFVDLPTNPRATPYRRDPADFSDLDRVRPILDTPISTRHSPWRALRRGGANLGWAGVGIGVFVAAWAIAATRVAGLPSPAGAARELVNLLKQPFANGGPNGKGIGLQLWASLQRVGFGFGLATVVGGPIGLAIGSSKRAWQAANPLVNLLRPVSPLAWFPIWLTVFRNAPRAAIWVIFITALWPIILNTAQGASSVPTDQRNVAKVFQFNRMSYIRSILVPHTLPAFVTGLRLSMGVSWMVIVAVEMLAGGSGIGFFVWDAYNASNLARVVAAIILIGGVGVAMDTAFLRLDRKVRLV